MNLSELISRVGDDNVTLQPLMECITDAKQRKTATAITFLTDQMSVAEVAIGNPKKIGLVVWLPKDKLDAALAAQGKDGAA
jgi:hypothetical protein